MRKNLFILVCFITVMLTKAQSPQFQWVKSLPGHSFDYPIEISILTDKLGNIYTIGNFSGTVDFDPSASVFNLSSAGNADIFVLKLDHNGNFIWAKSIGGTGNDYSYQMALDASGNVYTTGYFQDTTDFDPGSTTYNLITDGSWDIFISKLDSSGNFIWSKSMGGTGNEWAMSITLDTLGNVYTTGPFKFPIDFDPGAPVFTINPVGNTDMFISKLDSSGNFVWAKSIGGNSANVTGKSIVIDSQNNILICGDFDGTADFDTGAGINYISSSSSSNYDIMVLKLNAAGDLIWAKNMGGSNCSGLYIATDPLSNVYTTGRFGGTVDFDPSAGIDNHTTSGSTDLFLSKLDSAGNYVYAKCIGGLQGDAGNYILIDSIGNIYTIGYYSGTIDMDPGTAIVNTPCHGNTNTLILKLDSVGNFVMVETLGGSVGTDVNGSAITQDVSGNIYISGNFSHTVDFDPGAATYNITATTLMDLYILKLGSSVVGIKENEVINKLAVYPNPSNGIITLEADNNAIGNSFIVIDALGSNVISGKLSTEKTTIDFSSLTPGMYFLKTTGAASQVFKMVKE